jgi:hypothetical protein
MDLLLKGIITNNLNQLIDHVIDGTPFFIIATTEPWEIGR